MEVIRTFADIQERLRVGAPVRAAIVAAHDEAVIRGAHEAAEAGILRPVLIGDARSIERIRAETGVTTDAEIIDAPDDAAAAREAVRLVDDGSVQVLMKGVVSTAIFVKEILTRERRINRGRLLSHITVVESPVHGRLFLVTDAGINIKPEFDTQILIARNAAGVANALGVADPVAAVLCAVEKVNPTMPETETARRMQDLSQTDPAAVAGLSIMGPVSLDLAISPDAAQVKGYCHPRAGRADILIVQDIVTGNVLVKALHLFCDLARGGVVAGGSVPIALTSRSDSASERYNSALLAAYLADVNRADRGGSS